MAIEIQQPGMARLYGAAAVTSKAEKEAQRKQEEQARKEALQMQQQFQMNVRQLDFQLDLEKYERAKRWEIDKMELASQVDFQREEQQRQRKLDSADNALQQIDKEVLAGRMTEQEAYPLKLKYEMNKLGVDTPTSLLPTGDEEDRFGTPPWWTDPRWKDTPEGIAAREKALLGDEEDRYGIRPYYLEPEFERDYPELAKAKKREVTEGRTGTVPYYLDPRWLRENRDIAMNVLESKEIMLEEDEIDAFIESAEGEGVLVTSPTGEEGTIPIEDLDEALAEGYRRVSETAPSELPLDNKQLDVGVRSAPVGVKERLEAGEAKFYKPSLSTFFTMSPLRVLMERRKAKKLVR